MLKADRPSIKTEKPSHVLDMSQLLNALTSEVSALVAAIDLDYRYAYINQSYKDEVKGMIGKNLQIGMTVMDVYKNRPVQQANAMKLWDRAFLGESFKEVVKFMGIEDSTNFYEVSYTPIKDDQGNITGAVLVANNITKRLRTEHSLTESEMRYQQLFDQLYDGLAICKFLNDVNGQPIDYRILDINPNFTKILGVSREQIIGSTYSKLTKSFDLMSVDQLSKVTKTGTMLHYEKHSIFLGRDYEVFVYSVPNNCFAILLSDITGRKAEQDQREWLASFPEQNPMPVVEVDYESQITYQNPAAQKFFPELGGFDKTEAFLENISDVIERFKTREYSGLSKDVLIGNIWLHLNFYHMPQRNRIRIYSVEITERVNAENDLRDANRNLEETVLNRTEELSRLNQALNQDLIRLETSEKAIMAERKRFNDVLEKLPAYVILLTPQGHINFANKSFKDQANTSKLLSYKELQLFRSKSNEVFETFKPLQSGQPNVWEWVSPDNRIFTVHDYPFTDVDGSPLILEMGLEITEIRRAQETLLETSNYNRSLIEANLDFLATIDREGIITDVNAAAVKATGYSRAELIGARFNVFFDNPDAATHGLQLVLETGSVRNYELNLKHKSGHITPVAYNATFYTNLEGKIIGIFAGARDLTEIKQKESQLLELNRALQDAIEHEAAIHDQLVQAEKFAAMGRMLASVTHEINNPLQTISNCLYLISSDVPAESESQQFLSMAMSEAGRISKLVAELKNVYRPRQENNYAPVQLKLLLDEIYSLIKPQLTDLHVEWNLISDPNKSAESWVYGTQDQLKQVFINLCMNGIEAMQPKGGQLKLTLVNTNEKEIGILIADTGLGIEPENVHKIFDPFFSTKKEGLGLGLSICYDIIQRHHGHLDVFSKPGKGCTFEVWLPRYKAEQQTEQ